MLRAGRSGFRDPVWHEICLFSKRSIPVVRPAQRLIQWYQRSVPGLRRPGHEVDLQIHQVSTLRTEQTITILLLHDVRTQKASRVYVHTTCSDTHTASCNGDPQENCTSLQIIPHVVLESYCSLPFLQQLTTEPCPDSPKCCPRISHLISLNQF